MAVEDRIRELVERAGGRVPIESVVAEALGVSGATGALARKLVESAVREARGLTLEGDEVVLRIAPPAATKLAALATGRVVGAVAVPPSAAWSPLPGGAVTSVALAGRDCRPAAARLARSLAGTSALALSASAARRLLRFGSIVAGLDEDAAPRVVSLGRVARAMGRPLQDAEDAARLVGAPVPEELEGLCLLVARLADRLAELAGVPLQGLVDLADADVPAFDFGDRDFGRAEILALPEAPGVYLFEDEDGGVLYVGKAQDLRRRVSSYFGPGVDDRARRVREAARALQFERTGSELTALLREQELIRELAPALNVQEAVRPRPPAGRGPAAGLAVVLPSAEGGVEVVFADPARGVAIAAIVGEEEDAARESLLAVLSTLRARSSDASQPEAEIVQRWLAGRGEAATVVALDGAHESVVDTLLALVRDPDLGRGRIVAVT